MNSEIRQFYIVLKPEHEANRLDKIVLTERWYDDRKTAELNATKDSIGILRVCLEIQRKTQT